MSVQFQDYYETLGVGRDAPREEIRRKYRRLARELHPDVNKSPGAEERFKKVAEAYEVLGDDEKRRQYDSLGRNWRSGQEFRPPPGWENIQFEFGGGEGLGGFSSFFETLFGGTHSRGQRSPFSGFSFGGGRPGAALESEVEITLEDAWSGATREVAFDLTSDGRAHSPRSSRRHYSIKIPPGTVDGTVIRLAGQGTPGTGGQPAGDLLLRVRILPHTSFEPMGTDLETKLAIAPWEAVLGTRVDLPLMKGSAMLTIPPGSSSGKRLRLRGQGLPMRDGTRGDLIVELRIVVSGEPDERERKLYEELSRVSEQRPRSTANS